MSDLLSIQDFDSEEFIARLAGLYQHCRHLSDRALALEGVTAKRVAGMRLHTFKGLAEIGEALLHVQSQRPGEFGLWFATHQDRLGFSERHAESCKAAARDVQQHGLEAAFALARVKSARQAAPALRIPLLVDSISEEKARELFAQLQPIFVALAERVGAIVPTPSPA